jgi:hypothetical protein
VSCIAIRSAPTLVTTDRAAAARRIVLVVLHCRTLLASGPRVSAGPARRPNRRTHFLPIFYRPAKTKH